MVGGRREGRRPFPCTPAGEEREGGEGPPVLTLNVEEERERNKVKNIFIYPRGGNYIGSSASKYKKNH